MTLRILPGADRDLEDHITYFGQFDSRLGERFLSAVEQAFVQLGEVPEIGQVEDVLAERAVGIRRWHIPEFRNYLIFYRISDSHLEIIRILHGARDLEPLLEDL